MTGVPKIHAPMGVAATVIQKAKAVWDGSLKDFWNDPKRWDGITDPTKEMFWAKRQRDVIDVNHGK